jgi:hypothetical protein
MTGNASHGLDAGWRPASELEATAAPSLRGGVGRKP